MGGTGSNSSAAAHGNDTSEGVGSTVSSDKPAVLHLNETDRVPGELPPGKELLASNSYM